MCIDLPECSILSRKHLNKNSGFLFRINFHIESKKNGENLASLEIGLD